MPSDAQIQAAAKIRVTIGRPGGFLTRRATDVVELFGVDFTEDGIREVDAALAYLGLATGPPLSAHEPKRRTAVVIAGDGPAGSDAQVEDVEILVGEPDREYRVLAPLQARVEMKNLFSRERTVEEVNDALRKEAARLGANAVINVTYKRGMSATSWSALTANGTGVLLDPARGPAR